MARHASTYRQARREAYFSDPQNYNSISWREFNDTRANEPGFGVGSKEIIFASPFQSRSKYIPHTGAKQRAKGAAK